MQVMVVVQCRCRYVLNLNVLKFRRVHPACT